MKFLNWFKKKKVKSENPYTLMGRVGVSPQYLKMYEDSIKKIKNFK